MSMPVVITADSTVDLSEELIERYDIRILPLTINLGNESFLDGKGFGAAEIYERYRRDGLLPKTAAPSEKEFRDFFSSITSEGCEVVHLDISSELSAVDVEFLGEPCLDVADAVGAEERHVDGYNLCAHERRVGKVEGHVVGLIGQAGGAKT